MSGAWENSMDRMEVITKKGLNLTNWDKTREMLPIHNGCQVTFGQYLQDTEPEEWELAINMARRVLERSFIFLLEWQLDIPTIRNHAEILLTGGIVQEYQYDYRIAGVFAANALGRMKDEVR
jgi:hypothetical protein